MGLDDSRGRSHDHPSASACRGGHTRAPETAAFGRRPGGFRPTIHLRAEGQGQPRTFILTPGPRHEALVLIPLRAQGTGKRRGPGRPKRRPKRLIGAKASSRRAMRQYLRRHGIRVTMPRTRRAHRTGPLDRRLSRQRHHIARWMHRLKQFRRMATRDAKRAVTYLAMWYLATIILWL
jgi:transposase